MATIDTRREQMFPKLEPREIDRLRRFGQVRRYRPGEALFVTGEVAPGMFVLIKGSVRVIRRDALGHSAPIVEQGPGEFVAEVGQLSRQPAFVDVHAIDDVEALLIPPKNLRALMIEEPELGERIMRALILRRVALVEALEGLDLQFPKLEAVRLREIQQVRDVLKSEANRTKAKKRQRCRAMGLASM